MRILLVSKFLHHVGGVETYVRWLSTALPEAGHDVGLVGMAPPEGSQLMVPPTVPIWTTPTRSFVAGAANRLRSAAASVWSPGTAAVMRRAVADFAPDVVHFHGTCYQLTPSVVDAARAAGLRVVLTAHEYKLACANQTLFNDGTREMCTRCVGQPGWAKSRAILESRCMKNSALVSTLGAAEGRIADRVWARTRPHILAPSRFMRDMLIRDGWSPDQVEYLDLPWRDDDETVGGDGGRTPQNVVFLGRLAPNKGVDLLLRAWAQAAPDLGEARLRILGEGSEAAALQALVETHRIPRVDFLGYATQDVIASELRNAFATAHPSQWHENSPYSVRESLMAGVPAVVSAVGGMPEMVDPATGYVVPHDDVRGWSDALRAAAADRKVGSPALRAAVEARAVTRGRHLERLIDVYSGDASRAAVI